MACEDDGEFAFTRRTREGEIPLHLSVKAAQKQTQRGNEPSKSAVINTTDCFGAHPSVISTWTFTVSMAKLSALGTRMLSSVLPGWFAKKV